MYKNLMTFGCAAVLALGLAACGGGGGDDTADAPTTMEPTGPTLEEQLAAEKAAREAAEKALAEKQQAEQDAADEAKAAETAAAGKALKSALGTNPLGHLDRSTNAGGSLLAAAGLTVDQTQGLLAADPAAVTLRAGDSAGSLGDWAGTNYALKNAGTGVSNSAVAYTNKAAPKTYSIATRYATAGNIPASGGAYTAGTGGKGTLGIDTSAGGDKNIKAALFPTAGTKTFTATAPATEILVPGTYHGASGTYRCSGTCTATVTAAGITLSADWVFAHDAGAMVSVPDSTYLYFGWWLTKDKDGKPTAASAFHGELGDVEGGGTLADVTTITGTATYSGQAAGKFAISDPINGGDAGHFTADATLNAKFSGAGAGVTGMIDNFMANGQSVPWSVALNNNTLAGDTAGAAPARNFVANGAITSAPDYTTATPGVNDSRTTVWSIDGNAAPASGTWSGQMYDEALLPAAASDGSNVPTGVTGTFQSMFGSTHSMVGAFGATKQ